MTQWNTSPRASHLINREFLPHCTRCLPCAHSCDLASSAGKLLLSAIPAFFGQRWLAVPSTTLSSHHTRLPPRCAHYYSQTGIMVGLWQYTGLGWNSDTHREHSTPSSSRLGMRPIRHVPADNTCTRAWGGVYACVHACLGFPAGRRSLLSGAVHSWACLCITRTKTERRARDEHAQL